MQYLAFPMARTYTASEAARALGISLDTLRRWDRQGRIRVQRDAANRRVVTAKEVERLRGTEEQTLSARNRLEGVVRDVKIEGLLAQVELDVTKGARLVAVITRESAEALGLEPGVPATGVVKATSVMVER
jgi:molybdopterin-binding protein